ncbi:MAG: hypothetical protein M3291_15290 [Actinomycetota bacterium]|nr:hypothetical protein [Actinomycetota bacterium]
MVTPDPYGPYQRDEVVHEVPTGRYKAVRIVNGIIRVLTGLFAAVLAIHILLVVADANMDNDFAQFVAGWAAGVDLGLSGLFTPASEKGQVFLNEGLAAVLWLIIGAALTTLIARIVLPDAGQRTWYRRTVR